MNWSVVLIALFSFGGMSDVYAKKKQPKIQVEARELKFHYSSFDEAQKSPTYLKFVGSSTKFGLVTTSFDGFAKDFTVSYEKRNNEITQIELSLAANQLDTNSSGRNEKMYNKCLEADNFPLIKASLKANIALKDGQSGEEDFTLTIKDKNLNRKLKYTIKDAGEDFVVSFSSDFSFIEAGIADPSIVIAKVAETFILEGSISLKK